MQDQARDWLDYATVAAAALAFIVSLASFRASSRSATIAAITLQNIFRSDRPNIRAHQVILPHWRERGKDGQFVIVNEGVDTAKSVELVFTTFFGWGLPQRHPLDDGRVSEKRELGDAKPYVVMGAAIPFTYKPGPVCAVFLLFGITTFYFLGYATFADEDGIRSRSMFCFKYHPLLRRYVMIADRDYVS